MMSYVKIVSVIALLESNDKVSFIILKYLNVSDAISRAYSSLLASLLRFPDFVIELFKLLWYCNYLFNCIRIFICVTSFIYVLFVF